MTSQSPDNRDKPPVEVPDAADFLSADRPITELSQDLLGRTPFAKALARSLLNWRHKDSLVLALYGPWGVGKSSLKNLALRCVAEAPGLAESKPLIVEFNAWEFSSRGELFEAFFREIGNKIGRDSHDARFRALARSFRSYGIYLTSGASLVGAARKLMLVLLAATTLLLAMTGWLIPVHAVRTTGIIIAVILILLAAAMRFFGKVSSDIAALFQAKVDLSQVPISERKATLRGLLAKSPAPILVVLDDVDRLTNDEARLLLQLVKSNADFPQMIYLLLAQRETLARALEALTPVSGSEYLEKIVQVAFDVPKAERRRVHDVLFQGLDSLIAPDHVKRLFDERRWPNVFLSGIGEYFNSLRDVRRYLGSLAFHFELFRSGESFEVNPIDLIALECFRLFEPQLYAALHDERTTLTEPLGGPLANAVRDQEKRERAQALLAKVPEARRPRAQAILSELFPAIVPMLGKTTPFMDFERWIRDLRPSAPSIFDRYFCFAIPQGELSQADIERITSNLGDRANLVAIFQSLQSRGLLADALDRLEAYKTTLDVAYLRPFITALFDIGDDLPPGSDAMFTIEPDMHAARIIHWYLKSQPEIATRMMDLRAAIQDTFGLFLPIRVISTQSDEGSAAPDPEAAVDNPTTLRGLQELCVQKLREAASTGRLAEHARMLYLLYRWREWDSPEAPAAWVEQLTATPRGLIQFLSACRQKIRSSGAGDVTVQISWHIPTSDVAAFIPISVLQSRIESMPPAFRSAPSVGAIVELFEYSLKNPR